jgi:hypothetical protein
MKILLPLLVVAGIATANELDRIEGIVNEVTKLRKNHELCQAELELLKSSKSIKSEDDRTAAFERELEAERSQCENRVGEVTLQRDTANKKLETTRETITTLQATIRSQKKSLSACNDSLAAMKAEQNRTDQGALVQAGNLQAQLDQVQRERTAAKKRYEARILELESALAEAKKREECKLEGSMFPKLLLKDEYARQAKQPTAAVESAKSEPEAEAVPSTPEPVKPAASLPLESEFFKASAFRVTVDAAIYDAPQGNTVDTWEAGTSFTSGERRGEWIRITGHFVERQWHSLKARQLWVEAKQTLKR